MAGEVPGLQDAEDLSAKGPVTCWPLKFSAVARDFPRFIGLTRPIDRRGRTSFVAPLVSHCRPNNETILIL